VIIADPAIAIVGVFSEPDLPCLGEGSSQNGLWAKCSTTHYELLVKKLNKSAPNPKFKDNWDKRLKKYGKGLTIIRANQCPHTIRFADKIADMARKTYKLEPRIVELGTYRQAQNAPTPYAVFAVIYNGRLLADHQISSSRFRNIMNKILK